jgi:hypothetical protein
VSADGRLGWQGLGTTNPDPRALATGKPNLIAAAVQEQAFVLVTRVRRLPNGNLLVCDTGANRLVEMDRKGNTVWQYPDSDLLYQDPDRAANGDDLRKADSLLTLAQIRKPTPLVSRINGPRDVRRYVHDKAVKPTDTHVTVAWQRAVGGPVDLLPFGVTLRWETTTIADSGHNRVIDVHRPLVRIEDIDGLNQATGCSFASGFHYRPDVLVSYQRADTNAWEALPSGQTTDTLVGDDIVLKLDGKPYTKPLSMVAALRYIGPDGHLRDTYAEESPTGANYYNPMNGAHTRELLCAVGNTVPDPYQPAKSLRTVRISAKTPGSTGAVIRNFASLVAGAVVGDTQITVDYASELSVGESVVISYTNAATQATTRETKQIAALTANSYVGGVLVPATVTFTTPLANAYPMPADATQSAPRVTVQRANALAARDAYPDDYARVWQLDTVELRRQGSQGADEIHLLVVDASGVREVPADPARQTTPVFHMEQDEYEQAVRSFRSTVANAANWTAIANRRLAGLSGEEQAARQQTGLAWSSGKDMLFAPMAVARIDPSSGLIPEEEIDRPAYERSVRYLVSQMNTTASADPAARINGKSVPRIHLFEARNVNNLWAIMDNDLDYFVFPDPLGADLPALPGGGYPLTQPLCVVAD